MNHRKNEEQCRNHENHKQDVGAEGMTESLKECTASQGK